MRRKVLGIILCFVLFFTPLLGVGNTAYAADDTQGIVRVRLSSLGYPTAVSVAVDGNYSLAQNSSIAISRKNYTVQLPGDGRIYLCDETGILYAGTSIRFVQHAPTAGANNYITLGNGRHYLGDMEFLIDDQHGCIMVVNHVYLEEYLYGVVSNEMSESFPFEALKAQAVASRTFAARRIGGTGAYDLVDTSSSQVYKGYNATQTNAIAAVQATDRQVVKYAGTLADAYFSASNGGWTESVYHAWGSIHYDYSQVQRDTYDDSNPSSYYEEIFFPSAINADHPIQSFDNVTGTPNVANAELYIRQAIVNSGQLAPYGVTDVNGFTFTGLLAIALFEPDPDGHWDDDDPCVDYIKANTSVSVNVGGTPVYLNNVVLDLRYLDASNGDTTFQAFNFTSLRLFTVEQKTVNGATGISIFQKRYGHGCGLSQRGAQQRANAGQGYTGILSFYYPGIGIDSLAIEKPTLTALPPAFTSAGTVTFNCTEMQPQTYTYSVNQNVGINPIAYDKNGNIVKDYGIYPVNAGDNTITWDGKNSSNQAISVNLYPITIWSYAVNSAGYRSDYTAIVTINGYVDTQPPVITSAGTVNYDGSALLTEAYTYSISEKAGVNPIAYDKNGNIVKDYGIYPVSAGDNTIEWNGRNGSGQTVLPSAYPITIWTYAQDKAGNRSAYTNLVTINVTGVDLTAPVITSAGTVAYDSDALSTDAYTYSISERAGINPIAYDKNGYIVKNYGCYAVNAGDNTIEWDGKYGGGQEVSPNFYPITIWTYAQDPSGNRSVYSKLVTITTTVDTQAPVITSAGTVAYNSETLPTETHTYSISERAGVNPIAYDKNGNIVRDYGCYSVSAGDNTIEWNGKNSRGQTIASSAYPITIWTFAQDPSGNRSAYTNLITITTTVDLQAPVITPAGTVEYDSDTLPTEAYTYSISERAGVNPIAYDKNGNVVKNYGNYAVNAGDNTIEWNGKDGSGQVIASSAYPISVWTFAQDPTGNRSSYTNLVTINAANADSQPPVIIASGTVTYDCITLPAAIYTYSISERAGINPIAYDKNGNIVKNYGNYAVNAGNNTIAWNGKNGSGQVIASSAYPITIWTYAQDRNGNRTAYTNLVTITAATDSSAPVISTAGTVVYDCGTLPESVYTYNVSVNAGVNPIAYDKNGNIVKNFGCYPASAGANTIAWNGKDGSGQNISIELYPISIYTYAQDSGGNRSAYTNIVKILGGNSLLPPYLLYQQQSIYNLGSLPEEYYPFYLSEHATVMAYAYDKDGDLIGYLGSDDYAGGWNTIKWDGAKNNGSLVKLSSYPVTIRAIATDTNGKTSVMTDIAHINGEVRYTSQTSDSRINSFLNIAFQQYGDPYVWGAEGPDSFDCSGFIYYCLNNAGYPIGRTTASSYATTYGDKLNWLYVARENLQPGDLMFFYSDSDPTRIGHVGIYIGNDRLIHASSSYGSVIVCRFDGWYSTMFSHGRRVFY